MSEEFIPPIRMSDHQPPPPKRPDVFYDGTKYLWDNGRDFVPLDRSSVMTHLALAGCKPPSELCRIQMTAYVKYAGPLAGRSRGLVNSNGDLLLSTVGPEIITAKKGRWPTIEGFLRRLLCDDEHGDLQLVHFMGWMKFARLALLEGKRRPGQAVALAGPIQCGKTTLIDKLVKPGLGNRQAMPYRFLTDKTGFNLDLVGAELLVIDDDTGSTDIRSRRALGDGIKNKLFADSVRIEGKHRNSFTFDPLWRLMLACNDDPENLLVLPPLTRDLSDKIMLLHCRPALAEVRDDDGWRGFLSAFRSELPAWLHACENAAIPPELQDARCGIAAFQHQRIVDALSELSPEYQLLQMVDHLVSVGHLTLPWEGTARELKAKLTEREAPTAKDADRLLGHWTAACGVYLARLVGGRVERLPLRDGDQRWRVLPSSGQVETFSEVASDEDDPF